MSNKRAFGAALRLTGADSGGGPNTHLDPVRLLVAGARRVAQALVPLFHRRVAGGAVREVDVVVGVALDGVRVLLDRCFVVLLGVQCVAALLEFLCLCAARRDASARRFCVQNSKPNDKPHLKTKLSIWFVHIHSWTIECLCELCMVCDVGALRLRRAGDQRAVD